jgi:hypothetical protein
LIGEDSNVCEQIRGKWADPGLLLQTEVKQNRDEKERSLKECRMKPERRGCPENIV